jgi:hypothetical protein
MVGGMARRRWHFGDGIWSLCWAGVGALAAVGAISLGPLGLGPALLLAVLMTRRARWRRAAFGFIAGAGLPLLVVAYLNRSGPGIECYRTASSAGCDQRLDPVPWLVSGVVLVLVGLARVRQR